MYMGLIMYVNIFEILNTYILFYVLFFFCRNAYLLRTSSFLFLKRGDANLYVLSHTYVHIHLFTLRPLCILNLSLIL